MTKSKATKQKLGRGWGAAKQKSFSAEELLARSKAAMKKPQEKLGSINYEEAEERLLKIFK